MNTANNTPAIEIKSSFLNQLRAHCGVRTMATVADEMLAIIAAAQAEAHDIHKNISKVLN